MTGEMTLPLLSGFLGLIDLLDEHKDIRILAHVIQGEIIDRLLVGDRGERLRQIASTENPSHPLARAIDWLKLNFSEPVSIDELCPGPHKQIDL